MILNDYIPVTGPIRPLDPTNDIYPVVESKYVKGSLHKVDTMMERDLIPAARREEGMFVYVKENNVWYTLYGGITNSHYLNFLQTLDIKSLAGLVGSFKLFVQTNTPTTTETNAINVWINPNTRLIRIFDPSLSSWVVTVSESLTKLKIQSAEPSDPADNDIWIDTARNEIKIFDGTNTTWILINAYDQRLIDNSLVDGHLIISAVPPATPISNRTVWFDTNTRKTRFYYSGSWISALDRFDNLTIGLNPPAAPAINSVWLDQTSKLVKFWNGTERVFNVSDSNPSKHLYVLNYSNIQNVNNFSSTYTATMYGRLIGKWTPSQTSSVIKVNNNIIISSLLAVNTPERVQLDLFTNDTVTLVSGVIAYAVFIPYKLESYII